MKKILVFTLLAYTQNMKKESNILLSFCEVLWRIVVHKRETKRARAKARARLGIILEIA